MKRPREAGGDRSQNSTLETKLRGGHFLNGNRNEAGHPTDCSRREGNGAEKGTKGAKSFGSVRLQDERFRAAPLISETIVASTKN